jgi:hypothetical protein
LCGDSEKSIAHLQIAVELDANGGAGKIAKNLLARWRELIGTDQKTADTVQRLETAAQPIQEAPFVRPQKPLPAVKAKDRPPGELGPGWFAAMSFIFTPVISGLIMSWHYWRRFGKPLWTVLSMACSILIPLLSLGIGLLLARTAIFADAPTPVFVTAILLGATVGSSYGFVFALWSLLQGAYEKWHRGGREALVGHVYRWKRAALIWVQWLSRHVVTLATSCAPAPKRLNNVITLVSVSLANCHYR